ncbi:hypothetical protein FJZ26_04310, partial [Candidatus Parvarchaeota archaeon]|nr:hypothetical protein [Candidatus Parvarchaeota archaeon]
MKISTIQFKPSQNFTYHFLLAFALALLAFTSQASAQSYLVNQITNTSAGNITINVPKNTTSSIYSTAVYQTGILQQWKLLSIFAIMITLLVVALAYTFAIAFNTRELKAWADVEMGQVFVSAILVMGLLGTISFLDGLSEAISYNSGLTVDGSNPCDGITIPCSMRLAQIYLDDLLSVAKATGFDLLKKNIDYTNWASTSVGLSCDSMYCIWASGSYRPNAGYSMATDKYTLLFDDVSKITASLRAQRYFLDVISYSLGPILLLLGIVFRSLWFARKLGGLLLAVAVSLMVLYPLLYVFSWYTLKVATYGDAAFPQNLPPTCPSECQLKPPVNSTTVPGSTCDSLCPGVPSACREIPYPYQLAGACNETAWNQ